MVLYRIKPGVLGPPEHHPEEQGNYFIQGTMEWAVGQRDEQSSYICGPGTLLLIAPDEVHSNRVLGGEEVLVLTYFSPPRETHRAAAIAEM